MAPAEVTPTQPLHKCKFFLREDSHKRFEDGIDSFIQNLSSVQSLFDRLVLAVTDSVDSRIVSVKPTGDSCAIERRGWKRRLSDVEFFELRSASNRVKKAFKLAVNGEHFSST